jgi:hypothetical protein
MNQYMEFPQFEREISPLTYNFARARTITQHKHLGKLCEKLRLHALAAQTFRTLGRLEPSNRHQHGIRFLQNLQEASGRGCYQGIRSPLNN